jgi:hypothetical protein
MMTPKAIAAISIAMLAALSMFTPARAAGQGIPLGIIDLYGLSRLSAGDVRAALTVREGDTISLQGDERPAFMSASEARLLTLPGVRRARINLVCCDDGRAIVYVGIEERGAPAMSFRAVPAGDGHLAADIIRAGKEFGEAFTRAVERGAAGEDRSQGHALQFDSVTRAVQERFVTYANRDLHALRHVLRTASNAAERALAAQVLGYAADKSAVVGDLVYGMGDPSESVRNNAMRALLVIAEMTPRAGTPVPRIPPDPFIALLSSPVWSDRNKASHALLALTPNRDRIVLQELRRRAIPPLVEMARWRSDGHALPAFVILARIAGFPDESAHELWRRGEREVVIRSALEQDR